VDVELDEVRAKSACRQRAPPIEHRRRQDQRRDSGEAPIASVFDRFSLPGEALGGEAAGDDLAVGEGGRPRHVIEMPVTQHDREPARAEPLKGAADQRAMFGRDMGVEDDGVGAVDKSVAADAQRQRAVVDPVRPLRVSFARNATVVEAE
jgi:hypothetical protein